MTVGMNNAIIEPKCNYLMDIRQKCLRIEKVGGAMNGP